MPRRKGAVAVAQRQAGRVLESFEREAGAFSAIDEIVKVGSVPDQRAGIGPDPEGAAQRVTAKA